MDFSRLCINCMKEKPDDQDICPWCHFDRKSYVPDSTVLQPGEVLDGKYLIGRVLGRGGFGITYIAMNMALERVVAIKELFIRSYMQRDSAYSGNVVTTDSSDYDRNICQVNREKFEKEAKILASLDDLPGIVKVYDLFCENDTLYMVMEYLKGKDLRNYTAEMGGKIDPQWVLEKLYSVMDSLEKLHGLGIIHRDISPDNIMVLDDGTLKLLDFGGAKIQSSTKSSSMVVKKIGYTPIEQYQAGKNQGAWTDVYALAATIYYCICGKAPEESIIRVENDEIELPTKLGAGISQGQEQVLMKALSVKRQERYQSMKEFREALQNAEKYSAPDILEKEKETTTSSVPAKPGFNRKAAAIAVLVLAAAVGAGVAYHAQSGKSSTGLTEIRKTVSKSINNDWLKNITEDHFQIMDLVSVKDTSQVGIVSLMNDYYDQGVRVVRYSPLNGIELSYVLDVIKDKDDFYLILDLTDDVDMQELYDNVTSLAGEKSVTDRIIAMVNTDEKLKQWCDLDKAQDQVQILFEADNDGMTCEESIAYWKANDIKAVSFTMDSYWASPRVRSREEVVDGGISFFAEKPAGSLEAYNLMHPEEFTATEGMKPLAGIITHSMTPELYKAALEENGAIGQAKALRDMGNRCSAEEYLRRLSTSGFTVMFTMVNNGADISNISPALSALGLTEEQIRSVTGASGVVRTYSDGNSPEIVMFNGTGLGADELSENPEVFRNIYTPAQGENFQFILDPANITCGNVNYGLKTSGNHINIVVYDENRNTIVDRCWYDIDANRNSPSPVISKTGEKRWYHLFYVGERAKRKEEIISYFNELAGKKDDYLIIAATGNSISANLDTDITDAMSRIGMTAPFTEDKNYRKSYVGIFGGEDLKFSTGENNDLSDGEICLKDYRYDNRTFSVISRGYKVDDATAQIRINGEEMTNGIAGLHILVYDKKSHRPVSYAWLNGPDLKFNKIKI